MSAPVNGEQLEAEMWVLENQVPGYCIELRPRDWANLVSMLRIANACPQLPPEAQTMNERLARCIIGTFPKECTELHRLFASQWPETGNGNDATNEATETNGGPV